MEDNPLQEQVELLKEEIFQLKNIIKNMPGNVYWMNCNAIYQGCNTNLAKTLNFIDPDEIINKSMPMFWDDGACEAHDLNLGLMQKGESYQGEEHVLINDELHIFLSEKIILRDSKGKVSGLLGLSLDITDRKNMERALQEAKEKAEMANQAKTDFIRNMEHDLRTPLCGVLGVANHLLAIEADTDKKDLLCDIEQSVKAVLNYFDHIVEFSQFNKHIIPKLIQKFDLKKLIEGIISIESAALREKNINVIVDYADNLPTLIQTDRFRIHRILLNLVNNAVKFTKKGHIKIKVEMFEESEKKLFKIIVEDTGIGIAQKDQEMIFDKFTRCELTNKNTYKGTGLGLWIVKEFIKDMSGKIELISELNQGSSFTLSIPII